MIDSLNQALLNTGKGKQNKEGNKNHVYDGFKGNNKTIKDFYNDFVSKRLPDLDVSLRWHNMLEEYCNKPGAVYPIRAGNISGTLRRGWLTKTDQSFSYFYTDNDLALYIYKMALDGYCPTVDEFYAAMTTFVKAGDIKWKSDKKTIQNTIDKKHNVERRFVNFPVHFLRNSGKTYPDKYENEMNAFIINGPCCCLGSFCYKHSHIFDAGQDYLIDGELMRIKDICARYFKLGEVDDYKWDPTISNYVRKVSINTDDVKKYKTILKALMLRFLDPLNHFLSPRVGYNKFTMSSGEESADIAEYEPLLNYIKDAKKNEILNKTKHDVFREFEKDVLALPYSVNDGTEQINIIYDSKKQNGKITKSQLSLPKSSGGNVLYRGKNYSKRAFVIEALKDFIFERKINSLKEFETFFPKMAKLEADIKDKKRYSDKLILPNGEIICISNQIGDKPGFPIYRNYTEIKKKLINYGFNL